MSADLKARALRLLARREHTRAELARKLAPHAESGAALETLLAQLEAAQYLSDERYAEARARRLARKYGAAWVRRDLIGRGVGPEVAARLAAESGRGDLERARSILARKYRTAATNAREYAQRARFLRSRGFAADVIRCAVGDLAERASAEAP